MALREERTSISLCMCACAGARVCRKSELLNLQHFLPTRDITLRPLCQWDFILMGCYAAYIGRLRLKCDGTRAETRFRLSAIRTSPFKSAGGSVQSTTGRRAVHISLQGLYCSCEPVFCSHVTFTGYPLHSLVFLSFLRPCVTVCHHISNAV